MAKIAKASAVLAAALVTLAGCTAPSDLPRQQANIPAPLAIAQEGPCCGPIMAGAQRVLKVLDDSDVEHLWLKDHTIQWDTGASLGPIIHDSDTHCSAYTAAMAYRVGVYMPRPPQYRQNRLVDAQLDYFNSSTGRHDGWHKVDTPEQAQALANMGKLVIVGFHGTINQYDHIIGHTAVVRPSNRTEDQIQQSGPQISQAGWRNHRSTTVGVGFKRHPKDELQYFAHDIPDVTGAVTQSSN